MLVIYNAEFPKVYIGKSKNFDDRKLKHSYNTRYHNTKLTNVINKYGFESINWEIIYETEDIVELNKMEIELIKKYDSIKNGLRCSFNYLLLNLHYD